jgi:hypothetical protein
MKTLKLLCIVALTIAFSTGAMAKDKDPKHKKAHHAAKKAHKEKHAKHPKKHGKVS